jgi:hypothetical protein
VIISWCLRKTAGAGNITATYIKPITLHPPIWNVVHNKVFLEVVTVNIGSNPNLQLLWASGIM